MSTALLLTGCALPDKPQRPQTFDLGPAGVAAASSGVAGGVLVLPDMEAPSALDSPAMAYRLAYANAQVLMPYAQARWSMPPAQLLHQRLRQRLGASRAVLSGVDAAPAGAQVLRVELEEFSQVFDSPSSSQGHIRLRATLLQRQGGTESLVAQRSFAAQQPAPTPDAAGGAAALQRAVDEVAGQLDEWLRQKR